MIETIPSQRRTEEVAPLVRTAPDVTNDIKAHRAIETSDCEQLDSDSFSEKARKRFQIEVRNYSRRLRSEAVKASKRHQSEQVSIADVDRAARYLLDTGRSRLYRIMGAVGGGFVSIAASNILTIVTTSQPSNTGLISTFVLTVAGTALLVIGFMKD